LVRVSADSWYSWSSESLHKIQSIKLNESPSGLPPVGLSACRESGACPTIVKVKNPVIGDHSDDGVLSTGGSWRAHPVRDFKKSFFLAGGLSKESKFSKEQKAYDLLCGQ
jgi:hypothetical protein